MKHRCPYFTAYMARRPIPGKRLSRAKLSRAFMRGALRFGITQAWHDRLGYWRQLPSRGSTKLVRISALHLQDTPLLAELQAYPSGRCDDLMDVDTKAYGGARGGGKAFTPAELHVLAWRAAAAA